jgi:hypothetical protein
MPRIYTDAENCGLDHDNNPALHQVTAATTSSCLTVTPTRSMVSRPTKTPLPPLQLACDAGLRGVLLVSDTPQTPVTIYGLAMVGTMHAPNVFDFLCVRHDPLLQAFFSSLAPSIDAALLAYVAGLRAAKLELAVVSQSALSLFSLLPSNQPVTTSSLFGLRTA